MSAQLLYYTR